MFNIERQKAWILLAAITLTVPHLHAAEILEADPGLSTQFMGKRKTEEHFGSENFIRPQSYNHLLGSIYDEGSRETVLVFGFRLTESFIREWEKQGTAQLIFRVIEFHEGDPRKICPIHIEQLAPAESSFEAAATPPRRMIGTIDANNLEENRLYSFQLDFQEQFTSNNIVWIGIDGVNPIDTKNHNLIIAGDLNAYPGGSSPMLIAGSPEARAQTVHGMSLLHSLNRRFYAPKDKSELISPEKSKQHKWGNPFQTAHKLETLGIFRKTLTQELEKIPQRSIIESDRHRGFHSTVKPENEGWELCFPVTRRVTSIALYPAAKLTGNTVEAYAFPKRFRITAIPRDSEEPVLIADWTQNDFPQQGLSPVIFPFAWKFYSEVRLTVTKGVPMAGGHAFALAEVSFPRRYSTWPLNLPPTEESLEAPPCWSVTYATDGQTPFGTPAPVANATHGTFRTESAPNNPPSITIQVEQKTLWNSFEFYPTLHPDERPPEGFPKNIMIEFSNTEDFSKILHTEQASAGAIAEMQTGKNPLILRFPRVSSQYVRISFPAAPNAPENERLQLEEITFNGGLPLTMQGWYIENRTITGTAGTQALYDRIINGNTWNPPVHRSVNLIRRRMLCDELEKVENTMQAIRLAHQRTISALKIIGITLVLTVSGLILILQRRQSKKAQLRIRHRIQQDLHDEIGSKLSVISMITDCNKNDPELSEEHRCELADANHCARTAIASLTEVIWLTDKEILTLDQCFDVMKTRAEKMVHSMQLNLDFPKQVQPLQLSYQTKRNLILLFTEALNNALRHSQADTLNIQARLKDRQFTLSISDNGKGFSTDSEHDGIGIKSMNARARKIGGRLDISSRQGKGTTILFSAKL